ncbi:NAD(P)-dependent oxidoreductase [Bacillus sp. SRB3LM]|uniref:NAD-dependent epimerase/dehydratase family protein n=1 Tax=Bacillus sp. SRB3LM TaxID=2608689 RepID=UPI0018C3FC47|nr:NAD(P)-dependent oxidoreductase [Bacillus sp. SRB3LM]MBG0970683.1 NAD(P)-dependent oxidoreductase [Bacillus sp. SRB3LM]MBG0972731.1 NAD(P)-dependent oxidoreductase [Bacillus sp. SRB3LM]
MKNSKILVTGGHGFIGAHLVRRLLQEEAQVSILARENANLWRIQNILKDIQICNGDIVDTQKINNISRKLKPDYIFHLAADSGCSSKTTSIQKIKTNILGTANIVEAIAQIGCKKIINLGSSSEYGASLQKIDENTDINPIDIYGITKSTATKIAHNVALKHKMDIVTLRPFNIFGEGESSERLFPYVILQLLQGKNVHLTNCTQTRDYCYIENLITALILAAKKTNIKNEIFNIGSGITHSLQYFVEIIFENFETNKKPLYGFLPYKENERMNVSSDVSKIKKILNWDITTPLEKGIQNTIKWYKENFEWYLKNTK